MMKRENDEAEKQLPSKPTDVPTGCGHQNVTRHDYHTETWWQCEQCEEKFVAESDD